VRAGRFPAPEHCYPIDPVEADAIRAARTATHGTPGAIAPARAPRLARISAS
jgi:hypothetical protein